MPAAVVLLDKKPQPPSVVLYEEETADDDIVIEVSPPRAKRRTASNRTITKTRVVVPPRAISWPMAGSPPAPHDTSHRVTWSDDVLP